ncbi:MAG: PD40 domain-containing protein [Deltaproteobacteria bacterium]|nr:PD40 domain-containing protein [Deltaproteobacteria bacterium]
MKRGVFLLVCVFVVGAAAIGCSDPPRGKTFYEREIEPILMKKCAFGTSGCHAPSDDDPFGHIPGNLDVSSFDAIQKRRDALQPFGAYPFPLFLIKAVGPGELKMQYGDIFVGIDVQHGGGSIIGLGSEAFFTLQNWLDNGATESGVRPATPLVKGTGDCSTFIPQSFVMSDFVNATTQASFDRFKDKVQPIFTRHGCGAGSCHGAQQSDFYITCGDDNDDTQKAFNFAQAWAFVNTPVDDSQLLRVPLAAGVGGRGHSGGDQFPGLKDPEFQELRAWAAEVGKRDFIQGNAAKAYFFDVVQPTLLRRGCAFAACHSPQAPNDFKLRSGSPGFFSAVALQKNYDMLKNEFVAIEFPDARRSRAVAKTINSDDDRVTGVLGIVHRGGAVLESPNEDLPADPASCPNASAFCVFQDWVTMERTALGVEVTPMNVNSPARVVYVERTPGTATAGRLDFDEFHGGADLRVSTGAVYQANQTISTIDVVADTTSILGGCPGLVAGTADVQKPNVANDGQRVVFAARNSAAEPLGVFMVNLDGSNCQRVTPPVAQANGLAVHNFDPVFAPDGKAIVFASTRGIPGVGPTKSRKRFLPQSDLWRVRVDGLTIDQGSYEQVTFLSNSEVSPAFMRDGRITMTTEKASQNFYQLSGRRINYDLTDYHPLLAQRADSPYADPDDLAAVRPSVGYASATDIREAANGDFLAIVGDLQADGKPALVGGAGALALFNRSVGTFENGREEKGYLRSMRLVGDPNATGRTGATASYRHPFSMPDGTIMVAYAASAATGNFEIHAVNPRNHALSRSMFSGNNGKIRVDAVLAYRYPARATYANRRQLVFGGSSGPDRDLAILHMPDAPMTFTLLTGNLRRGRPVDAFRRATRIAVYSEGLCPTSGACSATAGGVFESRLLLGSAALERDGSVRLQLPASRGLVFELQDASNRPIVTMGEEHQMGPGERINMGVSQKLFDSTCGGCHGSISGYEADVVVTPDALTQASVSTATLSTITSKPTK